MRERLRAFLSRPIETAAERRLALAIAAAVLVAAGGVFLVAFRGDRGGDAGKRQAAARPAGGHEGSSTTAPRRTRPVSQLPTPRPVVERFAAAYLRYIDGHGRATKLPATRAGRRDAASGGRLPRRARVGPLRLVRAGGDFTGPAQATWTVRAQNRRRGLLATVALGYRRGRWRVTGVVPPDFATALAGSRREPSAPSGAARSARRFARLYLGYLSGKVAGAPGGPSVRRQIKAGRDPLGGADQTGRRATKVEIGPEQGRSVTATATIAGGDTFSFVLDRGRGRRWETTAFIESGGR